MSIGHGNVTEHFSFAELTKTQVRTSNVPDSDQRAALAYLARTILEPLRAHFGKPVVINSGFRSPEVNAAVGSKPTSQHTKGEAADIEIPGVPHGEVLRYIVANLPYDQLIAEFWSEDDPAAGWVHVSAVEGGRRQILTINSKGTVPGMPAWA